MAYVTKCHKMTLLDTGFFFTNDVRVPLALILDFSLFLKDYWWLENCISNEIHLIGLMLIKQAQEFLEAAIKQRF